jgi:hypothetical protein
MIQASSIRLEQYGNRFRFNFENETGNSLPRVNSVSEHTDDDDVTIAILVPRDNPLENHAGILAL